VKTIASRVAIAVAIVLVVGIGWFGTKQYRCIRRNAASSRRVKIVEQDAHRQLKVGSQEPCIPKEDVLRWVVVPMMR